MKTNYHNREYSREIIEKLLQWGVAEFYICAGARDIPLIEAVCSIESDKKIVFHHFEERSAAFYALGRIKSIQKPVAVITTSGTAVGELLPAVMESYYSGQPLVLLTADRPRSYRGSGAPQSAEQKNIFGMYVSKCFDLEKNEYLDLSEQPQNSPLHINVCFDVPLQSGVLNKIKIKKNISKPLIQDQNHSLDRIKVNKVLGKSKNLLVIVSQLFENDKSEVINFIKKLNAPVYIESISNLRELEELKHLQIKCGDKIWSNAQKSDFNIDTVVKIGGTPTHRIWRDLDEFNKQITILSISENQFSGMPNAEHICANLNKFLKSIEFNGIKKHTVNMLKFLELDNDCYVKLIKLFDEYPNSEQSLFYYLSRKLMPKSRVYLGNSLPIRNWDLAATFESKELYVDANRGLNGIDGQISSFIGFSDESCPENWGIFGDLTTLYDLAGPWMLQYRPQLNINIVIINNKGGKIFSKIISGEIAEMCLNNHNLKFEYIAKFWGIDYAKIQNITEIKSSKCSRILEIEPNSEDTRYFDEQYLKI